MKILILGTNGQVGFELMRAAERRELAVIGCAHADLDITNRVAVESAIQTYRPAYVINAAAYTAVDRAETDIDKAFSVNSDGAQNIASSCAKIGAALISYSTDYVFNGVKIAPYDESDPVSPLSVYGESKATGEAHIRRILPNHIILRTSWIFGTHGANFVKTILRLARERDELRIVADQFGCPTGAAGLAEATLDCVRRIAEGDVAWGTYHLAGQGPTNWHGFAKTILKMAAPRLPHMPRLVEITTAEYPLPARRPKNSVLNCDRIANRLGISPPSWEAELARVVPDVVGP